jgi:hypothetical protein
MCGVLKKRTRRSLTSSLDRGPDRERKIRGVAKWSCAQCLAGRKVGIARPRNGALDEDARCGAAAAPFSTCVDEWEILTDLGRQEWAVEDVGAAVGVWGKEGEQDAEAGAAGNGR